ncbi:MAG: hypothetical protein WBD22_13160 [Pyrinomonadaceae bacterium]
MIKTLPIKVWEEYRSLIAKTRDLYYLVLPANLAYCGKLNYVSAYVPDEWFFERLREWLTNRGEDSVYYFLTETTGDENTDFEITIDELTTEALLGLSRSENAIVSKNFEWAIFIDHEGDIHVAGIASLFSALNNRTDK